MSIGMYNKVRVCVRIYTYSVGFSVVVWIKGNTRA